MIVNDTAGLPIDNRPLLLDLGSRATKTVRAGDTREADRGPHFATKHQEKSEESSVSPVS